MLYNKFIKKLIAWLYAFVMLLPVLAIGVNCWYVAKNPNASNSYAGSYEYAYTTNLQKIYNNASTTHESFNVNEYTNYKSTALNFNNEFNGKMLSDVNYSNNGIILFANNITFTLGNNTDVYDNLTFILFHTRETYKYFKFYNIPYNTNNLYISGTGQNVNLYDLNNDIVIPLETKTYDTYNNRDLNIKFINTTNYVVTQSVNLTNNLFDKLETNIFYVDTTLSSVFYASTDYVFNAPLFHWVYDSFFYTPIGAFLNVFGVPTHSIFDCVLTYWIAISCIFIGFEIIMWFITFVRSLINDFNLGDRL